MRPGRVVTSRAQYTDEQLAVAARAGDERAFESLLSRCRPLLHGIAFDFFAPGLDPDDLRQAAAIGLVRAVRDWNPDLAAFRSFVHLCARRQVITAVIAARRMKHDMLNGAVSFHLPTGGEHDDLVIGDILADATQNPYASLVAREQLAEMLDAIRSQLTDLERDVLVQFLNGATLEQIEDAIEASTGRRSTAVWRDGRRRCKITENALQRARTKLRAVSGEPRPLGVAA